MKYTLKRFEEVNLTLFFKIFTFGFKKIILVGYLCESYRKKLNLNKLNVIIRMKAYKRTTNIRRFLSACIFYYIWILYYVYIVKPLYQLFKKEKQFT